MKKLPQIIALASLMGLVSKADPWDNSKANPYVLGGYPTECTAYGEGRYKVTNGEWLKFVNPKGVAVAPNADLMVPYVVESATVYRDSVPVRGALAGYSKSGGLGHVVSIENVGADGGADISEQNWPIGSGPSDKHLSAADLKNRPSRDSKGKVTYYSLIGFINPNRPPAFGSVTITKPVGMIQADVSILDEDGRNLSLIAGVVEGTLAVPGTAVTGSVNPNGKVTIRMNASSLKKGKKYSVAIFATDFKGLKTSKYAEFTW